jgi:hypothetical protein
MKIGFGLALTLWILCSVGISDDAGNTTNLKGRRASTHELAQNTDPQREAENPAQHVDLGPNVVSPNPIVEKIHTNSEKTLINDLDVSKLTPTIPTEELERQFSAMLTGATLSGEFTTFEKDGQKPRGKDEYTIEKVTKVAGDQWLFQTRIRYGGKDVTLPLPLSVRWAGDTPMIQLTKLPIPGLGTFSARVLFYEDHYAGTWSGASHGGHLFGSINRNSEPKAQQ